MIRMRMRTRMRMRMRRTIWWWWWGWWWWDDEEEEDDDNDDSMISCSMGWVILYLFHGRVGDVIPYVNLEKNARSCTVLLLTSPTHFHLFRLRSINFHWFLCYSVLRQTTGSVRTNIYDNTYNRYKRYSGYKRCTYTLIHYRISEFI
jgi:hypothetical protein